MGNCAGWGSGGSDFTEVRGCFSFLELEDSGLNEVPVISRQEIQNFI